MFYGKLGSVVSQKNRELILIENNPCILLIQSGKIRRYWAYIDKNITDKPPIEEFPEYYQALADKFRTWFRIIRFEEAPKDVLSLCRVASSGAVLNESLKHSMSPCYVIECEVNLNGDS